MAVYRACPQLAAPQERPHFRIAPRTANNGYLATPQLDAVAQLMQIPAAKVAGVASFYHFFRLQPRGRFMINVCLGTACYVKGVDKVAERLRDELGISWGETSKDGLFTLEGSRCLGTCGLAPVMMIGDDMHGQVTPDQVPGILEAPPGCLFQDRCPQAHDRCEAPPPWLTVGPDHRARCWLYAD